MKVQTGAQWVKVPKGTKVIIGFANESNGLIENKVVIINEDWAAQLGSGACDVTVTDIIESTEPL